jgi:hypothetical protein
LVTESNARLTVDAALVLLVLFAVQIATVLIGVRAHLALHVVEPVLIIVTLVLVASGMVQILAPTAFNGPRGAISCTSRASSFGFRWYCSTSSGTRLTYAISLQATCGGLPRRQSQDRTFGSSLYSAAWRRASRWP